MPIQNLKPTLFTTPNVGDLAVNSASTTGHISTISFFSSAGGLI